jgi:hypothetical protein
VAEAETDDEVEAADVIRTEDGAAAEDEAAIEDEATTDDWMGTGDDTIPDEEAGAPLERTYAPITLSLQLLSAKTLSLTGRADSLGHTCLQRALQITILVHVTYSNASVCCSAGVHACGQSGSLDW